MQESHNLIDVTSLLDMNLPLSGAAIVLVLLFLKVKTPGGSFHEKIVKLDWT